LTDGTLSEPAAELALERLLDHHEAWLLQQPELLILWMQGRHVRREVARLLAKQLSTIPVRKMTEDTPPSRAWRRNFFRALKRGNPTWFQGVADELQRAAEGPGPGVQASDEG
jgi:hypothetical protein